MSVKIINKEKLEENSYSMIVIREVDSNFIVNVSGKENNYQQITLYKLFEDFKKLDNYGKILSIVGSFLENSLISSIDISKSHIRYDGSFIKVSGTRDLYLQVTNDSLVRSLVKMIRDKYEQDRMDYCDLNNECNDYSIVFSNDGGSYDKKFVSCEKCGGCELVNGICPKYIEFKLMYCNGKILSFDKKFIEKFIYDKLWEVGQVAIIEEKTMDIKICDGTLVDKVPNGYRIICGDMVIEFNSGVSYFNYVNNIVNMYNRELNEIENVKKRQLKLEGI